MRKLKIINLNTLIFISLLFYVSGTFAQQNIPPKPKNQSAVYDQVGLFSSYEARALEQKLLNYADSTSTQIVVASIPTVNGENIALYATKWAHEWGIGQADKDNGVFVLIAKDDQKLTIQTGYGIEHLLTDNLSKRIISNIITPEFKKGNFYTGIDRGTSAIIQILNGEYQETRDFNDAKEEVPVFMIILFFIILLIVLSNIKRGGGRRGRRFRNNDTARSILEAIILSRSGRGGFGGGGFGGSSGGGFGGGFGGGGFGGGGASGGW